MEKYETTQQFQHKSTICYEYVDQVEERSWIHESANEEIMHMLKDLLKKADHKGHEHEMCTKFVSMVEKDVQIGGVLHKRVHDLFGKSGLDILEKIVRKLNKGDEEEVDVISKGRGAGGDTLEEIKLERFKVKTMNNIGVGVVKEEGH